MGPTPSVERPPFAKIHAACFSSTKLPDARPSAELPTVYFSLPATCPSAELPATCVLLAPFHVPLC